MKAFLPGMIKRGSGHLVTVASMAAKIGVHLHTDYSWVDDRNLLTPRTCSESCVVQSGWRASCVQSCVQRPWWTSSLAVVGRASKFGALGLMESVRAELRQLGHSNIVCSVVCPMMVKTNMLKRFGDRIKHHRFVLRAAKPWWIALGCCFGIIYCAKWRKAADRKPKRDE